MAVNLGVRGIQPDADTTLKGNEAEVKNERLS